MSLRERTEQSAELSAGHIWQTRSHVYGEVKCQAEIQSDVVIPNKLYNGETCQGLRHWRLLSNMKNSFSKPVRNDMGRHTEDGSPKYLHTLGSRFFAHARIKQIRLHLTSSTRVAQNDVKNVTNSFPYFPIPFSPP